MNPYPYGGDNRFYLSLKLSSRLESFFGADLSRVRLYRSTLPASLGCLALTAGDHVFMHKKWNPNTLEGRYVLAHEVAHVLQQRLSRLPCPRGHKAEVVIDPLLELEADINGLGFVWGTLDMAVLKGAASLTEVSTAGSFPQFQPVVTVFRDIEGEYDIDSIGDMKGIDGREYKTARDAKRLWWFVQRCRHYRRESASMDKAAAALLRTKLDHWVRAPKQAGFLDLFHKKGHDKKFVGYDNLSRALFGRIRSRDAKRLEARFAAEIASNMQINKLLVDGVKRVYGFHQTNLREFGNARKAYAKSKDMRSDYGRYADYYSRWTKKLRYLSKQQNRESRIKPRTYDEAFNYILNSGKRIPNYQIAAFLADYSMVARKFFDLSLAKAVFKPGARSQLEVGDALLREMGRLYEEVAGVGQGHDWDDISSLGVAATTPAAKEARNEAWKQLEKEFREDPEWEQWKDVNQFIASSEENEKKVIDLYFERWTGILDEKASRHVEDTLCKTSISYKADYGTMITKVVIDDGLFFPDNSDMVSRSRVGSHSNVNEKNAWVRKMREKGVRLGAGASATMKQTLQMFQIIYPHNETKLAVCLALFEFWNRHMSKRRSEIHTWHEVMVVARRFCYDSRLMPGEREELDYPSLKDLKDWLGDPFRKVVLTPGETRRISRLLEKKERRRRREKYGLGRRSKRMKKEFSRLNLRKDQWKNVRIVDGKPVIRGCQ